MIYVKNISVKPIGFGKTVLLPNQTGSLPDAFDESHPTVKFYLQNKYLAKVDASVEAERVAADAKAEAERKAAEKEAADIKAAEAEAAVKAAELDAKLKELAKMNLEQLKAKAAELNIEVDGTSTKATLTQKITEKYQSE